MKKKHSQQLPQEKISQLHDKIQQYFQNSGKQISGNSTSIFKDFYDKLLYIDKSMFIKDMVSIENHLFISAPQRWGKSLNLSMLKTFLNPKRKIFNDYLENNYCEDNPIWQIQYEKMSNISFVERYLGSHPVIHLNFRLVYELDKHAIEEQLRRAIKKAYEEHRYLHQWLIQQTNESDKDYPNIFYAYYNSDSQYVNKLKQIEPVVLEDSLKYLCKFLYNFFKKKVYVLVEEFDKPIRNLIEELIKETDSGKIKQLKDTIYIVNKGLLNIIGAVAKDNKGLKKIILTGKINTVQGSSELFNYVFDGNIMSGCFIDHFGFSKDEIENSILKPIFVDNYQDLFEMLEYWLNIFDIGGVKGLFNPYSVMGQLCSIQLNKFARFTSCWDNGLVERLLIRIVSSQNLSDIFKQQLLLISKGYYEGLELYSDLTMGQIFTSLLNNDNEIFQKIASLLLIKSGYLTLKDNKYIITGNQVRKVFIEKFLPLYTKQQKLNKYVDEIERILEANINEFKKFIQDNILSLLKGSKTESGFQALMFCLFYGNILIKKSQIFLIKLEYDVFDVFFEQDLHSGGKIDQIFYPVQEEEDKSPQILEIKKRDSNRNISETTENVIWQIILGNYLNKAIELKKEVEAKWKSIRLIGMTFYPEVNFSWCVDVKEVKIDFTQAEAIRSWVNKELKDHKDLYQDFKGERLDYEQIKKKILEKYINIKSLEDFIYFVSQIPALVISTDETPIAQVPVNDINKVPSNMGQVQENTIPFDQQIQRLKLSKNVKDLIIKDWINENTKYQTKELILERLKTLKKSNLKSFQNYNQEKLVTITRNIDKFNKNQNNQVTNKKESKNKQGLPDKHQNKQDCNMKYRSQDVDILLKKRISDEKCEWKLTQLNTHKSYEYNNKTEDVKALLQKVKNVFNLNISMPVIVPYAEEVHFIGLVFKFNEGRIILNYIDSENKEIKNEFNKQIQGIMQIKVETQKYNDNCGVEMIENFIGYLNGEDLTKRNISQDEAIGIHKKLIKELQIDQIKNRESKDIESREINADDAPYLEEKQSTNDKLKKLKLKKNKKRMCNDQKVFSETKNDYQNMISKKLLLYENSFNQYDY